MQIVSESQINDRAENRQSQSSVHCDVCPRLVGEGKLSCVSFKKLCSLICNCPVSPFCSLLPVPLSHTHIVSMLLEPAHSIREVAHDDPPACVCCWALTESASKLRNINAGC
jgi:hypothetical protein